LRERDRGKKHTMPCISAPEDKPKIAFYGAMMAIQNFGFFLMYYQIYLTIPVLDDCSNMRYWLGFFALDCFVESFCVLWMAMGGYIDSTCMFTFGWFLHLFVALPYCICSVGIPVVVYSVPGTSCRASMGPSGLALVPVVWVHVGLFFCYVWMMLSITYYSFVKPTFVKKSTAVHVK